MSLKFDLLKRKSMIFKTLSSKNDIPSTNICKTKLFSYINKDGFLELEILNNFEIKMSKYSLK